MKNGDRENFFIDEEYRTTNINMAMYFNIMFAETKLMESPVEQQNQVALYREGQKL